MLNRKHIAAIAIAAATASGGALADDGDVRHAEILLEQVGRLDITGLAAGQTESRREARRETRRETRRAERGGAPAAFADEQHWRQIEKVQSMN